MCVMAWSDLPNKVSIGTLSRGGGVVDTFNFCQAVIINGDTSQ